MRTITPRMLTLCVGLAAMGCSASDDATRVTSTDSKDSGARDVASGSGGASVGAGGGATGSGGSPGSGGMLGAGATSGAGGSPGSGGSSGSGGSPGSGGSGDAGLHPYKGVADSSCSDLALLGASWYYNYDTSGVSCAGVEYVPMVWGNPGEQQSAAGIKSEITAMVSAGYKFVLGFNEPDSNTQSNISVATAISLWPSFNNAAVRIGSPAPTSADAGLAWLKDFMSQVNADTTGSLRVDFIAFHWYGWNPGQCEANAASLEYYLNQVEAIPGNRPIWLTEFGCMNQSNPSAAVVDAFFSGALAMFAKHPRLERHAWFPRYTAYNILVNGGTLTSLGVLFAAAPAYK